MAAITSDPSRIPYELRPEFERATVRLCALSEEFWLRCGVFIEHELLGCEEARLLVKAIGEICKEGDHPERTGGITRVVQRVQRWSTEDGRVPRDRVVSCYEYLTGAEAWIVEAAVTEITPGLRRQRDQKLQKAAAHISFAEDRDKARAEVARLSSEVATIGKPRSVIRSGEIGYDDIGPALVVARLPRVSYGIPELDAITGGGTQKAKLTGISTYAGYGKSMMLNHKACAAGRNGLFSIYLTGEMLLGDQTIRIVSNATGVPMRAMIDQEEWDAEARLRWRYLLENKLFRPPLVYPFRSTTTSIMELFEVVEEFERRAGQRADLILLDADEHVDYSKVDFPGYEQLVKKDPGTYEGFGRLYSYLSWQAKGGQDDPAKNPQLARAIAVSSQVKGEPNTARFKILVGEDSADSKKKVRIVDNWITINWHPAREGNIFHAAKGRHDAAWGSTPALPRNMACAQMVKVPDEAFPWTHKPRGWHRQQGMLALR